MRCAPMLEQKNTLPGSQLQFSVDNRHCLARSRQDHANVRRHVIASFRTVREVICIFWHQTIEEFLHVMSRGGICILHDDHAATRVPNKNGDRPIAQTALIDLRLDVVGDFVHPLAVGTHFECFLVNTHAIQNNTGRNNSRALIFAEADGLIAYLSMQGNLERVLFDEPAINRRLDELAGQISNDYRHRELTVIAVLNGSLIFMADLLRRIQLPLKLDCLSVVSYHGKAQTSGEVIFKQVTLPDVVDRHILILDDILDSGHTLAAIREKLETAKPRSIRVCVLLSKKKQRARDVVADYVGFEIEDEFVVGYGLDFMARYRNLPYIGVLRKELIAQPG